MAIENITVVKTGIAISTSATSTSAALPTDSSGVVPKYVRLASTAACYVKLGNSSVSAAAGDLLVQPADSVVIRSIGMTHVAGVQISGNGILQVSPVEA